MDSQRDNNSDTDKSDNPDSKPSRSRASSSKWEHPAFLSYYIPLVHNGPSPLCFCWRIGNRHCWSLNTKEARRHIGSHSFFFFFFVAVTVYDLFVEKVLVFLLMNLYIYIYIYLTVVLTICCCKFLTVCTVVALWILVEPEYLWMIYIPIGSLCPFWNTPDAGIFG